MSAGAQRPPKPGAIFTRGRSLRAADAAGASSRGPLENAALGRPLISLARRAVASARADAAVREIVAEAARMAKSLWRKVRSDDGCSVLRTGRGGVGCGGDG